MKQGEVNKIKKGDFIIHKRLGLCVVENQQYAICGEWFGVIIRPLSNYGINLLTYWSKTLFNRILEHSNRMIVEKVENPEIPKLIFETKKGFDVCEWKKLGEVTSDGVFSIKTLKKFKTINEAFSFVGIKINTENGEA